MRLEAIAVHDFRPFEAQALVLGSGTVEGRPADTHIFVGENGTGKTRLLSLMLAACGNPTELADRSSQPVHATVAAQIGKEHWIWTSTGVTCRASGPVSVLLPAYATTGRLPGPNEGGNLSSRATGVAAMAFRSVATIRDEKIAPMTPVDWGQPNEMLVFSKQQKSGGLLSQALANMVVQLGIYGINISAKADEGDQPDLKGERVARMVDRLHSTLTLITGRRFTFTVEQSGAEMRLRPIWGGVRMALHQLPDGLRGIIGWLATCVARLDRLLPDIDNPLEQPILLFIDEPETHLHPAWQRQVLPALQTLLPNAQIFVATHSPFVLSSVNDGWLYVLKSNGKGVTIDGPKPCSKGDTYIDAVEDVLGLSKRYDPETENLLARFRDLRDQALRTLNENDKHAMVTLAREIAKRSESLEVMMGQELAQLKAKERIS